MNSRQTSLYKIAAVLLAAVLLVMSCVAIRPYASGEQNGDRKLIVSKTEYDYGEPILITAYGEGLDWVGIYSPDGKASILWVYIDPSRGGVGSGTQFDIIARGVINNGASRADIKPGKYIIRLMPDDTSDLSKALETVEITVNNKQAAGPKAPISAEYTPAGSGFGGGILTVKLSEDSGASGIRPFWANESGILSDYTNLPDFKVKNGSASYTFDDSMIIPAEATQLWVYSVGALGKRSEECFRIDLPAGSGFADPGAASVEFQVVSDIHITTDRNHEHNTHFAQVLKDISENSKKSIGLFVVGDMANTGDEEEYRIMSEMQKAQKGAPALFLAIGNHDLYNGSMEEKSALFLKYASLPGGKHPMSVHYDFWLSGFHFIFLGNDDLVNGVDTTLDPETLEWLRKTLDDRRDETRPVFLFIHQSLYNTVAGSLPGQGWNGVHDENAFRELLCSYPEVIMFNGHSHWTMDSESNIFRQGGYPTILNTASTAYLWTSYYITEGEFLYGSQGYYVSIYDDKIIIRGRDFVTGQWIAAAQYCLSGADGFPNPDNSSGRGVSWSSTQIAIFIATVCAVLIIAAAIIIIAIKYKKRV
ncbi:MAG: metallophosphoesterase [Clostridia bacterium]|nr:metallophosphoesterase [Clostridia bacterium]